MTALILAAVVLGLLAEVAAAVQYRQDRRWTL